MWFSVSARFEVPAGYAFDFLADPSSARVIDPAIREYVPDSLPMRRGTRNRIRFRLWGLPVVPSRSCRGGSRGAGW